MWVQLKSVQHIETRGVMKKYYPGDWVDVGKQVAQLWIGNGNAIVPNEIPTALKNIAGAGALILGGETHAKAQLNSYDGLSITTSSVPVLMWDKTVIWNASQCPGVVPIRFGVGLGLLSTWEMAVPLMDYKTLAINVGTDEERQKTKEIILDLRVPLYNTNLMFVRRTPDTERLLSMWRDEPGDKNLSFLRCLWKVKPFILALPVHWTGGEYAG